MRCTGAAKEGRTVPVGKLEGCAMSQEKIARVEAFPLRYAEPNNNGKTRHVTLVRLETAERRRRLGRGDHRQRGRRRSR